MSKRRSNYRLRLHLSNVSSHFAKLRNIFQTFPSFIRHTAHVFARLRKIIACVDHVSAVSRFLFSLSRRKYCFVEVIFITRNRSRYQGIKALEDNETRE